MLGRSIQSSSPELAHGQDAGGREVRRQFSRIVAASFFQLRLH
jgi:hypothetical protein